MTAAAKRLLALDPALISEAQLSGLVVELARLGGWKRYHTADSRRSSHGFPDWVFVKGRRLLFVELKSETGEVSGAQQQWLDALTYVGLSVARAAALADVGTGDGWRTLGEPSVEVHVWRPSDFDLIAHTLTGRKPRQEAA